MPLSWPKLLLYLRYVLYLTEKGIGSLFVFVENVLRKAQSETPEEFRPI